MKLNTKSAAEHEAKQLAGKLVKTLTAEQLTVLWRLTLAGYLTVFNKRIVMETK